MRPVVVTGLGAVTPLGHDAGSTWSAMLAGQSGAARLADAWAADLPSQVAAPVTLDPLSVLDRVHARRMDRCAQLALIAAREAWRDAGLAGGGADPERVATSIGTSMGGLESLLANRESQLARGSRRVSPLTVPMLMSNAPAAHVALDLDARAGAHCPVSACASGAEAISQAADLIRLGRADVVVAGGTDAVIGPLALAGFGNLQALTRRNDDPTAASRPWDKDRDGFLLGEGAGIVVVESLAHAQARGARIYAAVAGTAISNDAHDMVQPEPTGRGQIAAMTQALAQADLIGREIAHVNAHATSTPVGDRTEAASCRAALGPQMAAVFTSTKSMTGHLLGAAGAVEAIATIKAIDERVVPPTINLDAAEEGLEIEIATSPRALPDGDIAALSNSFGFGGANVALILTSATA